MRFALLFLNLRTETPKAPPASERSWEARVSDLGAEAVAPRLESTPRASRGGLLGPPGPLVGGRMSAVPSRGQRLGRLRV